MKISVLQLLSIVTFVGISAAVLTSPLIQNSTQWAGWGMILFSIAVVGCRYVVQPEPLRSHVDNDATLRMLAHLFGLGIPATTLVFGGVALLTWSLPSAFLAAFSLLAIHAVLCLTIPR